MFITQESINTLPKERRTFFFLPSLGDHGTGVDGKSFMKNESSYLSFQIGTLHRCLIEQQIKNRP